MDGGIQQLKLITLAIIYDSISVQSIQKPIFCRNSTSADMAIHIYVIWQNFNEFFKIK